MYTLSNNIVFDIFHSIVVCVDFLGTHMTSLVFFGKLDLTDGLIITEPEGLFAKVTKMRVDLRMSHQGSERSRASKTK